MGNMQKIQQFLKTPLYFQWLILFFVLHGYNENVGHIQLSSLALLIIKLSAVAWLLYFAFRRLYRDSYKSVLLVTVLFFCYLFFGAIQDSFATIPFLAPLSSVRIFFLLNGVVCAGVFTGLLFYKKSLTRLTRLLNLLFLTYIVYDVAIIGYKQAIPGAKQMTAAKMTLSPLPPATQRPDIYFILLDEYLGTAGLDSYFHFDNSAFENFLKQRGFHVCSKPVSNYSYTVYSMASLFTMDYIDSLYKLSGKKNVYKTMTGLINRNATWTCLQQLNYNIKNLSPFVITDKVPKISFNLVPFGIDLITDKTAYNRIIKKLPFGKLLTDWRLHFISKRLYRQLDKENESAMKAALTVNNDKQPTFTYLHLIMPHRPYIYDSTGKWSFLKENKGNRAALTDSLYLNYLAYTNKRISRFIDQLYRQTNGNAVILLMSDHGYRSENYSAPAGIRYSTLNAVYLPGRDYRLWYDSVSNVNQFPLLFNTLFGQQIPLKKDSTCF